ncbi:MAG: hypothetical protein QM763_09545 [Agriterribacter sp.]
MADASLNKTISSTNSGFPDYLDFNKLRSEAIAYLGNLSGKIWTDHNEHDPGITILEALIYALLDLGYRTNLPAADIFAPNPEDKSTGNIFFEPNQILANNPLTITDYRKLLVDIEGVRNAWLGVDDNISPDFCKQNADVATDYNVHVQEDICACTFLNGLYNVYVELEKDFHLNIPDQKEEHDEIIYKIKSALMQYRTFCEDFSNIQVLCKVPIGLCVDIELEPGADGETVYVSMIEALRDFFSPSPKFYTLPQMLEKSIPIEEIYAGRPFNITESHGFIDVTEFEQIQLRKELHLSDVYHVLLDVKGIKNVRNLAWKACNNDNIYPAKTDWIFALQENYIPTFDTSCSAFNFFKYGMKVQVNQAKYQQLLNTTFSNGKVLYKEPSPNLDAVAPQGIYHNDLADYYSIQNEFPHVYGIGEGDLPSNASNQRKAQALQLKGFLLFFDQLLANYLTQLKNVSSLFALSSSDNEVNNHTYFINQLTNVPQLQQLLRFKTGADGTGSAQNTGGILAYPTDRKNFELVLKNGNIKNTDLEHRCSDDFPPYEFCFGAVRDQSINQLREDMLYGNYEPVIVSTNDECFFFYLFTSSPDFVLISKKYYSNEQDAKNAAASLKYASTFLNNFKSFATDICENKQQQFSFDIELTVDTYAGYLSLIIEDENLYVSRRQDFLNHLLARFAEQFTDYALLSADFLQPVDLQKSLIKAEEKFLMDYPDLSGNRGKAYNYACNGWENENISGFEKRFKALAGIDDWRRHYLCNFLVEEIDKLYKPELEVASDAIFILQDELNKADTIASLNTLNQKLNNDAFFEMTFLEYENAWQLFTKDDHGNKYIYNHLFKTKEEAEDQQVLLQHIFTHAPNNKNIFISKHIFKIEFKNNDGKVLAEYTANDKSKLIKKEIADKKCLDISADINVNLKNEKFFTWQPGRNDVGNLIKVGGETLPLKYINAKAFEPPYFPEYVSLTEDVKYSYSFRDANKRMLFESVTKFSSEAEAGEAFKKIIALLPMPSAYAVKENDNKNGFKIFIQTDETNVAAYFNSFIEENDATKAIAEIIKQVNGYTYLLDVSEPMPIEWKFNFKLSDINKDAVTFESKDGYSNEGAAMSAAQNFYADISKLGLKTSAKDLYLESFEKKIQAIWKSEAGKLLSLSDAKKQIQNILKFHITLLSNTAPVEEKKLTERLKSWQVNQEENYRYKLVDKDNLLAYHPSSKNIVSQTQAKTEIDRLVNTVYDITYINTGGNDIICWHEDEKTKTRWYHYQITCTNKFYQKGNFEGKELILFESVKGYTSAEEARTAFNENYGLVLKYAHLKENYGDNAYISLKEAVIHSHNDCLNSTALVFVPKETLAEFNNYEAEDEIILLVKTYPVKFINKGRYKFSLYNSEIKYYDWRSKIYYATAQQAMQQFQFFLVLLKYRGNFYAEENKTDCFKTDERQTSKFFIYIREVLAESIHGFNTCEDAWKALEKFICVAQTKNGFHNYFKRKDCSHGFFVACGDTGILHPCKYETPERRNEAITKLFNASKFNFFDHIQIENKTNLLLYLNKKPVARIYIGASENNIANRCERLIEFFESVNICERYIQNEKTFYLADADNIKIAETVDTSITLNEWKKKLLGLACYFPVYRKNISTNLNNCNFYLQIKLPGFGSCNDDNNEAGLNIIDNCEPGCYVAWQSDCCFNSCCEALLFYVRSMRLAQVYENYKAVYECNCGYYGIELHNELLPGKRNEYFSVDTSENDLNIIRWLCADESDYNNERILSRKDINTCLSEVVAISPQQYNNEMMACDAVERAKKLINSEGLHVVEHILLRPHCNNANGFYDCNCDEALPAPCIDLKNICHFKWKSGDDEDACTQEEIPVCFTPGCDPYSFIATIALPAWPQRFRNNNNRAIIEKLLFREAPAHVLLRILWLNPLDFCCFEYEFKLWNEWLANKLCIDHNNCDFLKLLFKKRFDVISDCAECEPCECNNDEPVHCFDEEPDYCFDFNTQVNSLYCWNSDDDSYNFSACEACNCIEEQEDINKDVIIQKKQRKSILEKVEARAQAKEKKMEEPAAVISHEKVKHIQARAFAYKETIQRIAASNPENKVLQNAQRFLADVNPTPKRFDDLINQVLKDKSDKTKNIKALTLKQKQTVIQNITWQYLDRLCFNHQTNDIKEHTFLFRHLRKNKINIKSIYDGWNAKEVKEIEPAANIAEIKKWLV